MLCGVRAGRLLGGVAIKVSGGHLVPVICGPG
jgi:hypothetical protein